MRHALTSRWLLGMAALLAAAAASPAGIRAQDAAGHNPLAGNGDAIRTGMGMFRVRCADCHGMDARGIRGPDLTQVWASGRTDEGVFRIVRGGVPGTEMPAMLRATDEDVWKVVAYLRTLAAPAPSDPPRGDVASGERIFRAACVGCHQVNGRGGRVGPDLSRIGSARARAALVRRIRGAVEDHSAGYVPVTLTTETGQQIQATKKNEDLFSVQVMDSRERIQGYLKEDLREVTNDPRSRMPAYDVKQLSERDLDDLLAYLATLRGFSPEVQP